MQAEEQIYQEVATEAMEHFNIEEQELIVSYVESSVLGVYDEDVNGP
jgi:hypothetical protein